MWKKKEKEQSSKSFVLPSKNLMKNLRKPPRSLINPSSSFSSFSSYSSDTSFPSPSIGPSPRSLISSISSTFASSRPPHSPSPHSPSPSTYKNKSIQRRKNNIARPKQGQEVTGNFEKIEKIEKLMDGKAPEQREEKNEKNEKDEKNEIADGTKISLRPYRGIVKGSAMNRVRNRNSDGHNDNHRNDRLNKDINIFNSADYHDNDDIRAGGRRWSVREIDEYFIDREMKEGDYFGNTALSTAKPSKFTVIGLEPCVWYSFHRQDMIALSSDQPHVSRELQSALAKVDRDDSTIGIGGCDIDASLSRFFFLFNLFIPLLCFSSRVLSPLFFLYFFLDLI